MLTLKKLRNRIRRLRRDIEGTSILSYGGGPDKTPTQNVNAWHDAIATGTMHIHWPQLGNKPTRYRVDEPLTHTHKSGLLITGGGTSPQHRATQIVAEPGDYTLFDFTSGQGYTMRGVSPIYLDYGYTGTLIDARGDEARTRESKWFTFEDGYIGTNTKPGPNDTPGATGVRLTRGHGHVLRNVIFGRNNVAVAGREPGSYSNRVLIENVAFWENVVHVLDAGTSWTIRNATMQQGFGEGRPGTAFRQTEKERPLSGVSWEQIWHGDTDRGIGWELWNVNSMRFQGRFSCYSRPEPDPTTQTTIKVMGRVDGLDCSGAYFKGRRDGSIAIDLGEGLVSRFVGGSYGDPSEWWHIENPVKGQPT